MDCDCARDGPGPAGLARPGRRAMILRWSLPVAGLMLIPKCPGCIAAYVLLFTGVGLSLATAEAMRWALIGVCIAALCVAALRAVRRMVNAAVSG